MEDVARDVLLTSALEVRFAEIKAVLACVGALEREGASVRRSGRSEEVQAHRLAPERKAEQRAERAAVKVAEELVLRHARPRKGRHVEAAVVRARGRGVVIHGHQAAVAQADELFTPSILCEPGNVFSVQAVKVGNVSHVRSEPHRAVLLTL